jgi:hypothetical protein
MFSARQTERAATRLPTPPDLSDAEKAAKQKCTNAVIPAERQRKRESSQIRHASSLPLDSRSALRFVPEARLRHDAGMTVHTAA